MGWWLCHRKQEITIKVLEMPVTFAKVYNEVSCLKKGCEQKHLWIAKNKKPLPQCFSDPSFLGWAVLLFAECGFQGRWLKCCCCPEQRWATQMAVGHQAGFSPPNKGGNWSVWTHSLLLCLYPDRLWCVWNNFHFFSSFSYSNFPLWLKSDLQLTSLAKADLPPKCW